MKPNFRKFIFRLNPVFLNFNLNQRSFAINPISKLSLFIVIEFKVQNSQLGETENISLKHLSPALIAIPFIRINDFEYKDQTQRPMTNFYVFFELVTNQCDILFDFLHDI